MCFAIASLYQVNAWWSNQFNNNLLLSCGYSQAFAYYPSKSWTLYDLCDRLPPPPSPLTGVTFRHKNVHARANLTSSLHDFTLFRGAQEFALDDRTPM